MYKFFLQKFKRNLLHSNSIKGTRLIIKNSKPSKNTLIIKSQPMDEKEITDIVNLLHDILEVVKPCLRKKNKFAIIRMGITEVKRSIIPEDKRVKAVFDIDKPTYNSIAHTALDLGLTTDELLRRMCWAIAAKPEQSNGSKALPFNQA